MLASFLYRATAHSEPGPVCYRGFTITLRHATAGRTPLNEWSARRRDLYLTIHNTLKRQTSMSPTGFETTMPASERPQTHASVTSIRSKNLMLGDFSAHIYNVYIPKPNCCSPWSGQHWSLAQSKTGGQPPHRLPILWVTMRYHAIGSVEPECWKQGCRNPACAGPPAPTIFFRVVPNNCGSSAWNLLHVSFPTPGILRWLVYFFFKWSPLL